MDVLPVKAWYPCARTLHIVAMVWKAGLGSHEDFDRQLEAQSKAHKVLLVKLHKDMERTVYLNLVPLSILPAVTRAALRLPADTSYRILLGLYGHT